MDAELEMEEYSQKHMSRGRRIVGRVFRYAFRALVFGIIALVLWRVLLSDRVPKDAKTLLVNDRTYEAYLEKGDGLQLYTQTREQLTYREDESGPLGLFWASQTIFLPDADQVQILTRYNNSTLRHVANDFGLAEPPAREQEIVDVTLLVTTDPTPLDRENGDDRTTRYHASAAPVHFETAMYNYRKLIFDGVNLNDPNIVEISVDFYYVGNVNYEKVPYGTLCIYGSEHEKESLKLTARDKRALESYKSEP